MVSHAGVSLRVLGRGPASPRCFPPSLIPKDKIVGSLEEAGHIWVCYFW